MYSSQLLWMRLSLDELSDEISGIPLVESDKGVYRRMGENRDGVGSVEIEIMARRGVCKGEGLYREVEVVSVDCSGDGLYIGYEKKRCVLLMKRRKRNELRVYEYVEI